MDMRFCLICCSILFTNDAGQNAVQAYKVGESGVYRVWHRSQILPLRCCKLLKLILCSSVYTIEPTSRAL